MGSSCLISRLLLFTFLLLLLSNGFGRKMLDVSEHEEEHAAVGVSSEGNGREAMELDYVDAGPNTNVRSGYPFPTPIPTPFPPTPSPPPQ